MRHTDWSRMAGLAAFPLLAVGCAAFLIASGDLHLSVAGGALLLLAAGQFIFMVAAAIRQSRLEDRQSQAGRALRDAVDRVQAITQRLEAVEDREPESPVTVSPQPATSTTIAEMQALRQQLQNLVNDIQRPQATSPAAPAEVHAAAPVEHAPAAAAAPTPPAPQERLDLLLEPVIELKSGETTHYRAQLNMVDEAGNEVPHSDLMRKAEENGVRARLDVHLLRNVLPVFRRLRAKHPAMRLFVPVGAATLNTPEDVARLVQLLEQAGDVAPGVVLEIAHASLGLLAGTGIEGLARLGRLGTTMALGRVSLAGLDLMALRQLGVRYLEIDARTFEQGHGVAPAWGDFAQYARSLQFQLVAGSVETPAQSLAAGRLARFGYGPYFAPPRRVRVDAGQADASSRFQAA